MKDIAFAFALICSLFFCCLCLRIFKVFVLSAGGKKKQLNVDKPDDDFVADRYDVVDDYDFM